jgi:hypothetical protein
MIGFSLTVLNVFEPNRKPTPFPSIFAIISEDLFN